MAFQEAFQQAFIYLAATLVAILLGKKLGLGSVLGYLMVGAAIGPWGLQLTGQRGGDVAHFAEFGVVVMLFLIGLELQPSMLWNMRRRLFGLGSCQVVLSALALGGVAWWLGLSWRAALAVGLTLSVSSTAIVLQTLAEKGLMTTLAGNYSFSVLLFQDIAVIPIIAAIPLLGEVGAAETHHGARALITDWPGWAQAFATLGAVALIVLVARMGTRLLFSAIARARQREGFTAAALLLVISVALLMNLVGLSPALGAFVAGVVLASSEFRHELEGDLDPFRGILLGLFFLGVGAGIDFGYIFEHLPLVLGGVAALLLLKGLILFGMARMLGRSATTGMLFAASIAAGGEFAFVLITLALNSQVYSQEVGRSLTAIVALSMAVTPVLIQLALKFSRGAGSGKSERESDVMDDGSPVIICGFGRFGHAVGRLLHSMGYQSTVLDNDPDQVDLLRRIGIPIYFGDASRPELLGVAGADRAKILVIALKDASSAAKIVETARRYYPHLKIYLRAWSRVEAYEFIARGEELIYRDTLDSSIKMGADVLQALGESERTAVRAGELYREQDEAMVRAMANVRGNEQELVTVAQEALRSLDELMRLDFQGTEKPKE